MIMAIDSLTDVDENYFVIEQGKDVARNYKYNSRLQQIYYLDSDVTFIERSVYNIFMLVGDVGGFIGFLYTVFSFLMYIACYNDSQNYLVRKLFVVGDKNNDIESLQELEN